MLRRAFDIIHAMNYPALVQILHRRLARNPFLSELSSLRVSSESPIASRIVGGNWSKWIGSSLVKECSTGTFIVEYVQHAGCGTGEGCSKVITSAMLFLLIHSLVRMIRIVLLSASTDSGLCREESFEFNGPKASLEIASDDSFCNGAWYVVKGEGRVNSMFFNHLF